MSTRYAAMFDRLQQQGEGAFIPFAMLGDPDPDRSLAAIRILASSGATRWSWASPFRIRWRTGR